MILTCVKCLTQYMVDPAAIGADGRRVKCSRCGHIWHQIAVGEDEQDHALLPPVGELTRPRAPVPALRIPKKAPMWLKAGTVALAVCAVVMLVLALHRQLPFLGGMYKLVGIYPVEGLEVKQVEYMTKPAKDKMKVEVKGLVANTSADDRLVPKMRVTLLDFKQRVMTSLEYPLAGKSLKAGATIPFEPKVTNIPDHAEVVIIDIGNPAELMVR